MIKTKSTRICVQKTWEHDLRQNRTQCDLHGMCADRACNFGSQGYMQQAAKERVIEFRRLFEHYQAAGCV